LKAQVRLAKQSLDITLALLPDNLDNSWQGERENPKGKWLAS